MIAAGITGTGSYFPKQKVGISSFLSQGARLSDLEDWGVVEHRISREETVIDLEVAAAKMAIENAGLDPREIDLVIGSTLNPKKVNPPNINRTQFEIGAVNAAAFEVSQSCNSPIASMIVASQLIRTGSFKNILLVASSYTRDIVDPTDPAIYAVIGDGASAVVLSRVDAGFGVLGFDLSSDGKYWDTVGIEKRKPKFCAVDREAETETEKNYFFIDQPRESEFAFTKYVINSVPGIARDLLVKEQINISDISWVAPHQNISTIHNKWFEMLGVDRNKVITTHHKYGNLGPANVWANIHEGVTKNLFKKGDLVLCVGQGAGFSVGALILNWFT